MNKLLAKIPPKTRALLGNVLYGLILGLMVYKMLTARSLYEVILFFIPAAYCVYAFWGQIGRGRFQKVNEYMYVRCEPAAALAYLDAYPRLMRSKRYAAPLKLLRASALIDCGRGAEARTYITETEKEAFSTAATRPIAAYLLFTVAFLERDRRGLRTAFTALAEQKDAFTTGTDDAARPSTLWYIAEGEYHIGLGDWEQAQTLFGNVDPDQLTTNRDKAYYHYAMARICHGLGEQDAAQQQLDAARAIGPKLACLVHWPA